MEFLKNIEENTTFHTDAYTHTYIQYSRCSYVQLLNKILLAFTYWKKTGLSRDNPPKPLLWCDSTNHWATMMSLSIAVELCSMQHDFMLQKLIILYSIWHLTHCQQMKTSVNSVFWEFSSENVFFKPSWIIIFENITWGP